MITREETLRIMPFAKARVDLFLPHINAAMYEYEIVSPLRIAAFISQLAHESGELRYVRELADGKAYDTGTLAVRLGNTPEADGDGSFYKGRGLIQITGKDNYRKCSAALFGDDTLLHTPDLLENPQYAAMSAGWFWDAHHLNQLADMGDFRGITKKINGGYNGYVSRMAYYTKAKTVLDADQQEA